MARVSVLALVAVLAFAALGVTAIAHDRVHKRLRVGFTAQATATWYKWPSGGNRCGAKSGMCVAPSDGWDALWSSELKISKKCGSNICHAKSPAACSTAFCCNGAKGPSCPYNELCGANKGFLCVRCVDQRSGACRHNRWLKLQISDACPMHHPCNSCKGSENPCAKGRAHVDLCEEAYNAMADPQKQPDWAGVIVDVSTDLTLC